MSGSFSFYRRQSLQIHFQFSAFFDIYKRPHWAKKSNTLLLPRIRKENKFKKKKTNEHLSELENLEPWTRESSWAKSIMSARLQALRSPETMSYEITDARISALVRVQSFAPLQTQRFSKFSSNCLLFAISRNNFKNFHIKLYFFDSFLFYSGKI